MAIADTQLFSGVKANIRRGASIKNVDITDSITDEDIHAITNVVELYFPAAHTFPFFGMVSWLAGMAAVNIKAYGDTGFGDKPSDMNRFTYWIQHIDVDTIEAQVKRVRSMPLVEVTKVEKASKCSVCKSKIKPGQAKVYVCNREALARKDDISGNPSGNARNYCSNPECLQKMQFPREARNAPVVNSGGEETIDVANMVMSIQCSSPPYLTAPAEMKEQHDQQSCKRQRTE